MAYQVFWEGWDDQGAQDTMSSEIFELARSMIKHIDDPGHAALVWAVLAIAEEIANLNNTIQTENRNRTLGQM